MNVQPATGIILRTRPLTETSLIVNWLTKEHGRISTVAKGARRPKSNFRGKLDVFFSAEFSFARSQRSELHNLRELRLLETRQELRRDLERLQQAAYFAALIEMATEADSPVEEIYSLLEEALAYLGKQAVRNSTVYAFELKALRELGLFPDLEQTKITPGTRAIVQMLTESGWEMLSTVRLSADQDRELNQFLHGFLIYHLGKLPRGRAATLRVEG